MSAAASRRDPDVPSARAQRHGAQAGDALPVDGTLARLVVDPESRRELEAHTVLLTEIRDALRALADKE